MNSSRDICKHRWSRCRFSDCVEATVLFSAFLPLLLLMISWLVKDDDDDDDDGTQSNHSVKAVPC